MTATFKKIELLVASVASIVTFGVILAIHSDQKEQSYVKTANDVLLSLPKADEPSYAKAEHPQIHKIWDTVTIRPGDTLNKIFAQLNLHRQDLWKLLKLKNPIFSHLNPGIKLKFLLDQDRHLLKLEIPISIDTSLVFTNTQGEFSQHQVKHPLTTKLSFKSGQVTHSLIRSMLTAGISNKLSHQFFSIFQSKVDFRRDIHPGDRFSILYKEFYINGTKQRTGGIAAAELITRNHTYQAINFDYPKNHNNYYTPTGQSLAHRFLPYPVKFKRISSHFSYNRMDPIAHRKQPHLGIDLAAKRGTPIKSIGNGRIIYIGHDRGYGNAIKVRYDRHYSALYAHMKHFASNLKLHQYIHRGQTIGYVGSTGWSTGPHLHFGFYINGVAQDWLKLKPPYEPPIPRHYKKRFKESAKTLLATLELYNSTVLAENAAAKTKLEE